MVPGPFSYFLILCSDFDGWASPCHTYQLVHIFRQKTIDIVYYLGPPKGDNNYEEAVEFDPIVYHNQYCPWVNGNVAAAGCPSSFPGTGSDAIALCGWQLTLDALQSLGNAIPTVQSESAASLYKVVCLTPNFVFPSFT